MTNKISNQIKILVAKNSNVRVFQILRNLLLRETSIYKNNYL